VGDHARGVVGPRCGKHGELELVEVDRVKYIPSILGVKTTGSLMRKRER